MKMYLVLLPLAFLSSCTHVSPYDKEDLASPKMLSKPLAEQSAFESRVFSIKEGSFGAEGGFGGGCGCK